MQENRRYSFYGFHGTAESCAIEINKTIHFEPVELRDDHWLGQGSYFYKDDEEQAKLWAKNKVLKHAKYKGETPCVIEVVLEANESNFLNLDSRIGLQDLDRFISSLKDTGMKIETTENVPAKIRNYILSLLPSFIWMIQRTFEVPSKYDKLELFVDMELKLLGTQICVRNNEVIKGNSLKITPLISPVQKRAKGKPRLLG